MNRYVLNADEQAVYDRVAAALVTLPESSQYAVLRNVAHAMDRDIVRKGSIRAAAAVAGSTARTLREAEGKAKPSKKATRAGSGYPAAFKEGPGKQALREQAALRATMTEHPSDAQKEALRQASEKVRCLFRAFNEGTIESSHNVEA
jgi:hypothetical protein